MRIALVAPSPVPFVIGGAEKLWWGLQNAIHRLTPHLCELIKLPSPERNFWEILASYRRFAELDLSHFDRVITINLRGAFICTREAAKIMTKARHGRIVNISSVVGQMGNAGQANYSAAKAGLLGLTKSCAKELAARQITVNAVAPGFIETDMTAALSDDVRASYEAAIPLKRMGTAQANISRFESGNYNPSLAFLQRMAESLGKTLRISLE